ncbi:MAG: Fic family protein [Cytophagales bacterium]|nr:Fic family protein [Armatimonadota bacterium]
MSFARTRPYNDLPMLPPSGVELETRAVLKQAIAANRALAQLKGSGDLLPNHSVLVRVIGLQEAKLSSEIENIVTTNDELYRAFSEEISRASDPHTKEVLSYNDALWYGYNRLTEGRPLATRLFAEIAQIIKQSHLDIRTTTGTQIQNSATGEAIYTPPEGESVVRNKLSNLEDFLHAKDDLDPLVKMAILHYQFEAIHPFTDGNGRTGRILNILYLIHAGLLDIPVLYLSRYIIAHKSDYYAGLRQVTENSAWEEWILFLLRAVESTATETYERIQAIRVLMQETTETVRASLPRIYSKDLIEVLFAQPYCKIKFLEDAGLGHRQTASKYLHELAGIGVLKPLSAGRERYFLNTAFLDLLAR